MKNYPIRFFLFLIIFLSSAVASHAQVTKMLGRWKTIDDKSGKARSVVRIFKATNGFYYGKIEKLFEYEDAVCVKCTGEEKNKPIAGMMIIKEMKEDESALKGSLLDPESGKTYYGTISYDAKTGHLKLRGSIDKKGILGRNQYWLPVN